MANTAATADEFRFYISSSLELRTDTPKLTIDDKLDQYKWFDDRPNLKPAGRLELGIQNSASGLSAGIRLRTLQGNHIGSFASYNCIVSFCGWIDGATLADEITADLVTYKAQTRQFWIKKNFELSEISVGIIGGLTNIHFDLRANSAIRNIDAKETVTVPSIGTDVRYRINERTSLAYNLHYLNYGTQRGGVKFVDQELELIYRLSNHLYISSGYGNLLLEIKKRNDSETLALAIPQRSPYFKMTFAF
jgi:hypothetical protein